MHNHGLSLFSGGDVKQFTTKKHLSDMIEVWFVRFLLGLMKHGTLVETKTCYLIL